VLPSAAINARFASLTISVKGSRISIYEDLWFPYFHKWRQRKYESNEQKQRFDFRFELTKCSYFML
jgi:hypothetical protein